MKALFIHWSRHRKSWLYQFIAKYWYILSNVPLLKGLKRKRGLLEGCNPAVDAENQGVEWMRNLRVGWADGQSRLSLYFKKVQRQPGREGTLFLGPHVQLTTIKGQQSLLLLAWAKNPSLWKLSCCFLGKSKSCTGWLLQARNRIKELCEPWAGWEMLGKCSLAPGVQGRGVHRQNWEGHQCQGGMGCQQGH